MEFSVLDVILAVLRNKFVIIVFIVIILYLSFINYIIRYKQRPKKVKPKKVVESAPAPKPKKQAQEEDDDYDDDEEMVE